MTTPKPVPSQEAVELGRKIGHYVAFDVSHTVAFDDAYCNCTLPWPCKAILLLDAALRAERERTLRKWREDNARRPSITIDALNYLLGNIASWTSLTVGPAPSLQVRGRAKRKRCLGH